MGECGMQKVPCRKAKHVIEPPGWERSLLFPTIFVIESHHLGSRLEYKSNLLFLHPIVRGLTPQPEAEESCILHLKGMIHLSV